VRTPEFPAEVFAPVRDLLVSIQPIHMW
jgi:hypothetical protein